MINTAIMLINQLKKDIEYFKEINPIYISLVKFFPLQPITSSRQYKTALKVLEKLILYINNNKASESFKNGIEAYFKTLANLVKDYEKKQLHQSDLSGTEMLHYIMKLQRLTPDDLSKELGKTSLANQILKGKRPLNLQQIKALSRRFKVSPEIFMS